MLAATMVAKLGRSQEAVHLMEKTGPASGRPMAGWCELATADLMMCGRRRVSAAAS
jgi:hypothetical protein